MTYLAPKPHTRTNTNTDNIMKTNIAKLLMLAAIGFFACVIPTRALGAAYVVGIPRYNSQKQGAELFQSLLVFMLETAVPGDEITVCDALNQKLVTRFVIPEGKQFQANARARAQRLAAPMAALKQFLMTEHSGPAELAGAIAFPQFLDFAATQLRRPDQPLRVVILASPFYVDVSGDGACSMTAAVPSDAHLTAEQQYSPFGCASRRHSLNGVTVHYAFLNAKFLNDYQQGRIARFWTLYCQQAGGVLGTFCADGSIAFQRARDNIQQPCIAATLDPNDTKIEMRQVVRRGVPVAPTLTNVVGHLVMTSSVPQVVTAPPSFTSNPQLQLRQNVTEVTASQPSNASVRVNVSPPQLVTNAPAPALVKLVEAFPVKPAATKIGVGIAWSASVDLDLWIKPSAGSRELCFNNQTTREGRYFRDWRDRNLGQDYELVELDPAPDLDLSKIEAWVNYYAGKSSPVRGVVVLFYQGHTYYGEFLLPASGGNKAGDKDKRAQSRHWVRLNLAELVKSGNKLSTAGGAQ